MARNIDYDNLDIDSVRFLRERPWLIKEAEYQGYEDIEDKLAEIEQAEADKVAADRESGAYDDLGIKNLRQLARDRNLDSSGRKVDLISRLKEDDERQEALNAAS